MEATRRISTIGEQHWPPSIVEAMEEVLVQGRPTRVFSDAPDSLFAIVRKAASKFPTHLALSETDGQKVTYQELLDEVLDCASVLSDLGVTPESRVGMMLENSIEFVVVLCALNALGAVASPLPGKYHPDEIVALMRPAGLEVVICEDASVPKLAKRCAETIYVSRTDLERSIAENAKAANPAKREALITTLSESAPSSPDRVALLMFTSGTTSASKRVLLTNRNVTHAAVAYQRVLNLTSEDSTIIAVPMYHITGVVAIIATALHCGMRLHIQKRFRPKKFLDAVEALRITYIHASPTVFALLLKQRPSFPDLPDMRLLACGAAPMPVSMIRQLHDWMPHVQFRTVYGLTETSSPATVFPVDAATSRHLGSSGVPVPGVSVQIRGFDDSPVTHGERGEIWLRGTCVTSGYDGLTWGVDGEGWLRTGDVGYTTEDGYLYVVDRTKNMINRGGEKIWTGDVEEALRSVPGVEDACVVGLPDPLFGEVPGALLVPQSGVALDVGEVTQAMRNKIASFEIPDVMLSVEALPLSRALKVDKDAAKDLLQAIR